MPVGRLPSLRQPRIGGFLLFSTGSALLCGLGLELAVRAMLPARIQLPTDSPDALVLRTAAWLTGLTTFLCALTLLVSGALAFAFRRAIEEGRLPPSDARSIGPARPISGPPAIARAKAGLVLAAALGLCSVALGSAAIWFVARVLACAARWR